MILSRLLLPGCCEEEEEEGAEEVVWREESAAAVTDAAEPTDLYTRFLPGAGAATESHSKIKVARRDLVVVISKTEKEVRYATRRIPFAEVDMITSFAEKGTC